jgi:hypothetical protein
MVRVARWVQLTNGVTRAFAFALALALGNSGCGGDECTGGISRCNGNVLESCIESAGGVYLSTRACEPGVCIPDGDNPFCALDRRPDERCARPNEAVCDGASLVTCRSGFATAAFDCAVGESPGAMVVLTEGTSGACIDTTTPPARCVAEAERDPACPIELEHFSGCSGNDQVDCQYGYVIRRKACGAAFCRQDFDAVCSVADAPDPACFHNARTSSFCEGDTLVECEWGYRVSQKACSVSEVCAPFSVENAVCKPRP